jgi:DNA replication protein DnaC
METYAQIKQSLKKLRLSSIAQNIEQRTQEALDHQLSYIDYLLLLLQDEIDARNQKKKELLVKKAKLGRFKHLMEFDFTVVPGLSKQKILSFTSGAFIDQSENIMFVGPTGTGKTFLSKAIAYEACCKNYKVIFTRTAKMLEDIYAGKADGTYTKLMDAYIKPHLLILDDWGLTAFPNHFLTILNEIISERYENGAIIITSNRPIETWDELFNEPVVSSALLDRLFHNAHLIKLEGKSYRRRLNL